MLDLPIGEDVAKTVDLGDIPIRRDLTPMTEDEANAMRNDVPFDDADIPPEIDVSMYDSEDAKIDDTT